MDSDAIPELPPEVKQAITRYKAPPGLERRVRHMLRGEPPRLSWRDRVRTSWLRWVPVAASFACGALVSVAVLTWRDAPSADVGDEVVAAHVRSLQVAHLTDVASTDRHTVKPWFTGKLDYAPPTVDLAREGFPLVGGRLDYIQGRPTAALVYRHGAHTVNVFVLPAGTRNGPAAIEVRHGFQVAAWEQGGMRFWAVSDVGRDEMAQFVAAMKAAG
jgi:anti-sigma factor RsiW